MAVNEWLIIFVRGPASGVVKVLKKMHICRAYASDMYCQWKQSLSHQPFVFTDTIDCQIFTQ